MATLAVQAVTRSTKPADVERRWYVVDAGDQVLGRLATRVATLLRGKHKPTFTPHVDEGDFVIVVNAEKVKLTGRKREQKTYYRHTGYTGHLRSVTAEQVLAGPHADRVVRHAVRGMLPKNTLGRQMLRKLKELPNCRVSNTERPEPKRKTPYEEKLDPILQKLRSESALPMCTKSSTVRLEPNLEVPYSEHELPRCM